MDIEKIERFIKQSMGNNATVDIHFKAALW